MQPSASQVFRSFEHAGSRVEINSLSSISPSNPAHTLSSTDAMNPLSGVYDVIRVTACLAVILLHLSATVVMQRDLSGTMSWHVANLIDAATRWCVPVFVMLSGALLLDPQKHAAPQRFWIKRMSRLLPALVVWSAIYFAWRALFWKETLTVATVFQDLAAGRPYIHLYFLFLIAGLYLITPVLSKTAHALEANHLRQAIVVIALLALGENLFDFLTSSAFTMFIPYIAYYLAGWYCARMGTDRSAPYGLWLTGAIVMTTLLTAILVSVHGLDDRWSFYFYEDFSPTVLVMSITVFMLILRGATHASTMLLLAKRLATLTLGVYLAHPIVVELLRYGYYKVCPIMFRPLYYVPLTFVFTSAITFGLVALMQKIPGLRRIV